MAPGPSAGGSHGFFRGRRPIEFEGSGDGREWELCEYPNVPARYLGVILETRMATLHELQTVYSVEDAQDLLEVILVKGENEWRASRAKED